MAKPPPGRVQEEHRWGRHTVRLSELLVEFAGRARNEHSAGSVTLTVFHSLYDTRRLAALGAIRALGRVHNLLTISRFGDLGHD